MAINEVKKVTARKKHYCSGCNCPIPKGFKYNYHTWVDGGDIGAAKYHDECLVIMQDLNEHDEWFDLSDLTLNQLSNGETFSYMDHVKMIDEKYPIEL